LGSARPDPVPRSSDPEAGGRASKRSAMLGAQIRRQAATFGCPIRSQPLSRCAGLRRTASWRSGYAEDCKSLHGGSIPSEASIESMTYGASDKDRKTLVSVSWGDGPIREDREARGLQLRNLTQPMPKLAVHGELPHELYRWHGGAHAPLEAGMHLAAGRGSVGLVSLFRSSHPNGP
jgi:hypothetical protein